MLADTVLFTEMKEPLTEFQNGEATKKMLCDFCNLHLQQTMPAQGVRVILAFLGLPCKWHDEQCTLAEFSAYIARDVIAHIDLAAEAKVKKPKRPLQDTVSEDESDSDDAEHRGRPAVEFADVGGGNDDGQDVHDLDVPPGEMSNFPLHDVTRTISLCFQQDDIASLPSKTRKSQGDVDLIHLDDTYGSLLHQNLSFNVAAATSHVCGYGLQHNDMVALQKKTIALANKQQSRGHDDLDDADAGGSVLLIDASQPAEPQLAPLPLAMQGPAAVARKLAGDANCTEEQTDAVALLALSLQKRFDARPNKTSVRLPVATAFNKHRAIWLGGGGVDKTRTLGMVVQPLAETHFGL